MENIWLKYGVLGAVIVAMGVIIRILWNKLEEKDQKHQEERIEWLRQHKEERIEWLTTIDKQFDKIEIRDKEQHTLLKDLKYLLRIKKSKGTSL